MKIKTKIKVSRRLSAYLTTVSKLETLSLLFFVFLIMTNIGCKTQKNEITPQQRYPMGYVKLSNEEYANIPKANAILAGGTLPSSFSLEIPEIAFDQGQQGSCSSCATAGAKSIEDHMQYGVPYLNNSITYSPSFLYNQAKVTVGDCNSGSTGPGNFNILIQQGDCQITDMPYDPSNCSTLPNSNQQSLAGSHKISQFLTIAISASTIKQYIFSGLPVIVAFQVDNSFDNLGASSIWSSFGTESLGWHCTLLYGWDDSKNAFKMLNSWGPSWANNGSTWIDYNFLENGSSPTWGKIFGEAYIIENSVIQNSAPVANFDVNGASTNISQGQSLTFYDRSQNSPTLWQWTFPGGNPASSIQQNPTVTYPNAGSFAVSLKATNAMGNDTKTVTNYITVNSPQSWTCGQPFTDTRDGQVYQTININGTCWLAENLRFTNNNQVGIFYENSSSNYNAYGCLYSFNDVINGNLAPPGWHIATYSETQALGQYVLANYNNNGGVLKSTSNLWIGENVGATNATGFNALPSGNCFNGNFSHAGNTFYMWTSTAQGSGGDAVTLTGNSSGFGGGYYNANYYFAIRCVRN